MSSIPPRPASQADLIEAISRHSRTITIEEARTVIERQTEVETSFLLHFVNEAMPGGMDRLRPEQVEHTLRLIAALRSAADALKSIGELSPVARELMGLKP